MSHIPEIKLVDSESLLKELVDTLLESGEDISIDFEGEFNLHRYGMHLCLVQIYNGTTCWLVDTVAIVNSPHLKRLFTSRDVKKIMFSCQSDLNLLHHVYEYQMCNIEDLQIGASLLEVPKLSLKSVLDHFLRLEFPSDKKNQRANWNTRPLRQSLMEYAALDVAYLPDLKQALEPLLEAARLKDEYDERNVELESIRFVPKRNPHLGIKHAKHLHHRARIYLKHFFGERDRIARELDMSPHAVIRNDVLIMVAKNPPSSADDWKSNEIMTPRAITYADRLHDATVAAGEEVKTTPPPPDTQRKRRRRR